MHCSASLQILRKLGKAPAIAAYIYVEHAARVVQRALLKLAC